MGASYLSLCRACYQSPFLSSLIAPSSLSRPAISGDIVLTYPHLLLSLLVLFLIRPAALTADGHAKKTAAHSASARVPMEVPSKQQVLAPWL